MRQRSPYPAWIFSLLRTICPDDLVEQIEGDLIERFENDRVKSGIGHAKRRLIFSAIRFIRPGIILRNKFSIELIQPDMILNYLLIAFRNFRRQTAYTLLNILGLSLGMAASVLIFQYVKYERSFDRFHSRADDIYRIQYNRWQNGVLNFESAVAVPAISAALKNNFAEVEQYTRFLPSSGTITYEKPGSEPITFRESRGQFADTSVFKVFDFSLLEGNERTSLRGVNKVIISEAMAQKYFKDESPIGKRLSMDGDEMSLEVTGVFANVPENSHIKFDFLISYETINARTENESENSWGWYDFYSFVLLKPGTDVVAFQKKVDDFLAKTRGEEWKKANSKEEFILRPLTDIHLYSNLLYETNPKELRDGDSIYALSIIALFILIIAWVNYVNLATARSFKRANEVGVRKVVGAYKSQLVVQFLTESFLLNLTAAIVALAMVRALWTPFAELTGWHLPLSYMFERDFWILVVSLFFLGALLSGFYPAVVLTSFRPVAVLKGKAMGSRSGSYLRKGLVVFQFVASVFLISGSVIVYQQLQFMKHKDLGINIRDMIVLQGPEVVDSLYVQRFETFKEQVLNIPGVKSISASSSIPGEENYWTRGINRLSGGPEGRLIVTTVGLDHEFIPVYDIAMKAGRNFSKEFPGDDKRIMINETLSRDLLFRKPEDAIGEMVQFGRDTMEIVGVVADYHQMSLKAKVIPHVYWLVPEYSYFSIKTETHDYEKVVSAIEQPWQNTFPGNPLDYFFLDQFFNKQYERDDRFSEVFTIFTILAIFIASLGLLGLASFMTIQRTREIGIRKVLGSSVPGIIMLLSKGFIQLVLLAIVISIPLCYWLMGRWLQSFPYHIEINVIVFLLSGILVTLIAFLSVSTQTVKAAFTKPAETLKYE